MTIWSILFRLVLACICGGLIGLEREVRGRPAGMKTFALVCVGASLAMMTNILITTELMGGNGDATRMGAQVISGIGFLGAGTILVTHSNQIRGLTTAAGLWATAAIGISVGTGFYQVSILAVAVILSFSYLYRLAEQGIVSRSRMIKVLVEVQTDDQLLALIEMLKKENVRVQNLTRVPERRWHVNDSCVVMDLVQEKRRTHGEILALIRDQEGLRFAEEIV